MQHCIDWDRKNPFNSENMMFDDGFEADDNYFRYLHIDYGPKINCFPNGTPVLMGNSRFKNIKEVCINDIVFTHTGRRKKVIDKFERYYAGPIYKFKVFPFIEFECTPEHPLFWVKEDAGNHSNPVFISAGSVEAGDYLVIPKFSDNSFLNEIIFNSIRDVSNDTFTFYVAKDAYTLVMVTDVTTFRYEGLLYNLEVEDDNSYIVDYVAVHNCTGVSMAHVPEFKKIKVSSSASLDSDDDIETEILMPVIKFDFVGKIQGSSDAIVELPDIQELIINELARRGFNLRLISFDGYQSLHIQTLLIRDGYPCDRLSLDHTSAKLIVDFTKPTRVRRESTAGNYLAGWQTFKDAINQGRISTPI